MSVHNYSQGEHRLSRKLTVCKHSFRDWPFRTFLCCALILSHNHTDAFLENQLFLFFFCLRSIVSQITALNTQTYQSNSLTTAEGMTIISRRSSLSISSANVTNASRWCMSILVSGTTKKELSAGAYRLYSVYIIIRCVWITSLKRLTSISTSSFAKVENCSSGVWRFRVDVREGANEANEAHLVFQTTLVVEVPLVE
jgi:hypothetical protein